jgi:hypothetical protein
LLAASLCLAVALVSIATLPAAEPGAAFEGATRFEAATSFTVRDGFWERNGKPTYEGTRAEGLLLNVRMAHALFEDRNPETSPQGFDPEKSTAAFIEKIPDYVASGVLAFTVNLQGGDPGYKGALNSAFDPDGSLRPAYAARAARVIEACDRAGAAVILGCFSRFQDEALKDGAAVEKAVVEVARWVRERGYRNVLLEVADDHLNEAYSHEVIRSLAGMERLLRLAKKEAPQLLVSASGDPDGRVDHEVGTASDYLLLHLAKVPPGGFFQRASSASKHVKALVCNDDVKTGAAGVKALEAAVSSLCSWGYANREVNERYPFRFGGAADDPPVYAKMMELTTPGG